MKKDLFGTLMCVSFGIFLMSCMNQNWGYEQGNLAFSPIVRIDAAWELLSSTSRIIFSVWLGLMAALSLVVATPSEDDHTTMTYQGTFLIFMVGKWLYALLALGTDIDSCGIEYEACPSMVIAAWILPLMIGVHLINTVAVKALIAKLRRD